MTGAAEAVRAALDRPGARWFEGLAAPLARSRWRSVSATTGLNRSTYGTARFLDGDPSTPRDVLFALDLPEPFRAPAPVLVESLHGRARERYAGLGLEFHPDPEALADRVAARMGEAFSLIGSVPALAEVVGALLAVAHVVRPEGPDYDVSYSDPALPFSIFVGVDPTVQANGDLRLAEGIVHECMHLQLSLVEGVVPLVGGSDARMRSPWQGTMRPVQGILHGLYVFRVIQDFHRTLLSDHRISAARHGFLLRRVETVDDEARAVRDVAVNPDLTDAGRDLAARLVGS